MLINIERKVNSILQLSILSFPVLIIIGPLALNCFSIIFSLYALYNFKLFKNLKIFDKKTFIFFFSFLVLIFPFESIDFKNSFIKYLSFFRFLLMLFGLIIFFEKENNINKFFIKIYKTYTLILVVIIIDVIIEYTFGSNIFGNKSYIEHRIASFTNDELIIGYILCFTAIFTLKYIFDSTNSYYFFIILSLILTISFIIGERSNFLKLFSCITLFILINYFYLNKFRIKSFIVMIVAFLILSVSFYNLTKNTPQGKSLYRLLELNMPDESRVVFNIKKKIFVSHHAPHYVTAYKIFKNNPIFGIGINNFYMESIKEEYIDDRLLYSGGSRGSNHPHQIYLEVVSEVGLVGLVYFLFIFFYPIYLSLKTLKQSQDVNILSHLLLHIYFIFPLLPSGSIFGTNTGVPFWLNLTILIYLSQKKLKIRI